MKSKTIESSQNRSHLVGQLSPRSVQPISGSIPSNHVSNVFLAQVIVSTKSTPPVSVLALLDSGANSCFMDQNFAQASQISLRKLSCPASVVVIDGRPLLPGIL